MEGEKQGSAPASGKDSSKRRTSLWKIAGMVVLFLFFVAAGTITGAALYVGRSLQPMPAADRPVRVMVGSGAAIPQITKSLKDAGLIRSDPVFTYYLKYKKEGLHFQAGEYEFSPGVTIAQLIEKLNKGDTVKEEVNRFTIPEGFTVNQIAQRLADLQIAGAEDVLTLVDTGNDWTSSWAAAIPNSPDIRHRLEGYLFPETYELKKDTAPRDIVQRMLGELDKKLAQLPEGWQDQLKARGLTFHQLLTVASLIEREAALDDERPVVAGVIYNRLGKKMPLQIDATIQYLFDQPKERLIEKDLKLESPYNTYLHEGLPPGPIANPSLSSIKAALEPADTKYFYYVTRKDGSKAHLFAETFEQHQQNIAQSKKNGG